MTNALRKVVRFLTVPIHMLAVWLTFLIVLWATRGGAGGVPALCIAIAVAGILWWRSTRLASRRRAIVHGSLMVLALAPVAYVLAPLAPSSLAPLSTDPSAELWSTGPGRAVAVYRYPADAVRARHTALVFVHGGPGAYVRDIDRAFFAGFARAGFDVVLYDQVGAGRSSLLSPEHYTHDNNVKDLAAVLARVNMPTVLVAQSYGATLVTSALANLDVRKLVTHLILTEPGSIPGAAFSLDKSMSKKTTHAPDATLPPSVAVMGKLLAPRAMLAAFLPAGNGLASQEELINNYTPDVQRLLVSNSFCKGDTALLNSFHPGRFNLIANARIKNDAGKAATPDLHDMAAPVMMLLGECSYIPRGRAMEYFGVYSTARAHLIPGVGHIVWGNARGQELTRDAIVRFVDGAPGVLPNEPTQATARLFVENGR
ncbi:alpha/beta hydrolase [Massilia arenae]|uniref:Alpha/beta hydrolase n=1 Tax=Massilia arenae TaxID=2603288 RepID=A0A5C7G5Z1_9BURK|nr:alpha/beta hydrolase [Massilia arenae]TXG01045.1 alpha/beta hydrolase [Massilia arenae]